MEAITKMALDTWTKLRTIAESKHSGTAAVAACVVVGMWYGYAAGYTPEPPLMVMAAAAVAAAAAFNAITPDDPKRDA